MTPILQIENVGEPPTEAEVQAFADGLVASLRDKDAAAYLALVDWDAILEQATSVPESPVSRAGFTAGFKATLAKPGGLFEQGCSILADGGSIVMLGMRDREGRPWALFRLLPAGAGHAYQEYRLARRPDGKVRAVDLFVHSSGERMVETIHRAYLPSAIQASRGRLASLVGKEDAMTKARPQLKAMTQASREGRFKEAIALFDALPAEVRRSKVAQLVRLQAAQGAEDTEIYLAAINEMRAIFPNDPGIDFISFDAYVLQGDLPAAIASLESLDRALGGDPYLRSLRATYLAKADRLDEARDLARAAAEAEPGLAQIQVARVTVSLLRRDPEETLVALRQARDLGHSGIDQFAFLDGFADFAKTPQYTTYQEETARMNLDAEKPAGDGPKG